MDYSALFAVLLGGLGSLVLWLILGPLRTGYGFKRLVRKAAEGDPKSLEVFMSVGDLLITWASQREIKTGKKVKVATDEVGEDGKPVFKEVEEILSPIQIIAQTIGSYVIMKAKGSVGGTTKKFNEMLMSSASESGVGPSSAALNALARGNPQPFLVELILPKVIEHFNKRKGNEGSQGGW